MVKRMNFNPKLATAEDHLEALRLKSYFIGISQEEAFLRLAIASRIVVELELKIYHQRLALKRKDEKLKAKEDGQLNAESVLGLIRKKVNTSQETAT